MLSWSSRLNCRGGVGVNSQLKFLCNVVLSPTVAVYLKNRRLGSGEGKR